MAVSAARSMWRGEQKPQVRLAGSADLRKETGNGLLVLSVRSFLMENGFF